MENVQATSGNRPSTDILPIFIANYAYEHPPLIAHTGTGFLVGKNLFITCWHCVRMELENDLVYVVLSKENGEYVMDRLRDVQQDPSGTDLATVRVDLEPEMQLTIAAEPGAAYGNNYWTYGYPLTDVRTHPSVAAGKAESEVGKQFNLNGRYMESYTMRAFKNDWPGFGPLPSWELDMPALAGMSGAPIIRMGSREVIGVLYGHHEAETIEEFGTRDPQTGERLKPEVVRRNYFAVAHYTTTLQGLRGNATEGQTLPEYLHGQAGSADNSETV